MRLREATPRFTNIWGWIGNEILRLKQITGLTELFRDTVFGKAWVPKEKTKEDS